MIPKDPRIELVQKVLDEAAVLLMAQLPILKRIGMDLIDTILIPKVVARQVVVLIALEAGMVTCRQVTSLVQYLLSNFSARSRLIRQLQLEQQKATTQDEWMDLAERIDQIQGNDLWRSDPNCALYERERISARIDEFVHLMRRQDVFDLMFVLRGSIGRNKFGLLHEGLFTKALAGTKVLVETYHNVICAALDFVCDAPVLPGEDHIPTEARLAFFNETRHSYGRTALLLSGGAALGFYHVGVVQTLMENRLMPRVIGGSSAGSIVCAMIGTRTDEECINDFFDVKGTHAPGHSGKMCVSFFRPMGSSKQLQTTTLKAPPPKRTGFFAPLLEVYDNTAGAFHDAKLTLQGFTPIPIRRFTSVVYDILTGNRRAQDVFKSDTEYFRNCVRDNVGNFTFQEAFDRTGRILNIVVTPQNSSDPPRLLNYLTAPHVLVWSAAVASSSLPGVFEANRLVVKEADGWERYESGGSQAFSDGSMEQDLPMQQLSEMFNVNHFIISQANPHAVMFASYNSKISVWSNPITGILDAILNFLRDQVRAWIIHLVEFVGARRIAPLFETQRGIGATFLTQEYEGRSIDISLVPWHGHRGLFSALLHVIYNPSEAEFRDWIQAASRETWRHIPAIKSHIAEEVTLDRCVQRLRRRLIQESWEKRHRLGGEVEHENMAERVPSFFNSPSLLNMGGLNIADQQNIDNLRKGGVDREIPPEPQPFREPTIIIPDTDINSGWGGLGLRGNRSSGNLERTMSEGSGLFIDDEEHAVQQNPGEDTISNIKKSSSGKLTRSQESAGSFNDASYLKTTSMAHFYYRKNPSFVNVEDLERIRKTTSHPMLERDTEEDKSVANQDSPAHRRQRSRSHADLL